ncbi:hypothetical protein ILYODFUR_018346 [Ilyodon furcidens]|uniref:LRRNT domain-containing protein n=1 Tax=Ilyodon furcidens TaxID=33524 RepID=A0ABV0SZT4_9TELE
MSVFQDYLSSMLDCPPTCSCSQTEIYCNKSDNGRFFPLLALQDTGSNGTSVDIADLFKNITSMYINRKTCQAVCVHIKLHLRSIAGLHIRGGGVAENLASLHSHFILVRIPFPLTGPNEIDINGAVGSSSSISARHLTSPLHENFIITSK